MNNRIYGLIGLCMKAGKVLSGNEQVEKGIRKGKGYLLILAADSSEQTKKRLCAGCRKTSSSISYIWNERNVRTGIGQRRSYSCTDHRPGICQSDADQTGVVS